MPTYAIGDIQGCFATFERLLERIEFSPGRDTLWLAGDLVNRGPRSADVLRWCADHDGSVVAVLGNHDLHVLGVAFGAREWRQGDTAHDVVEAVDSDRLIEWLAHRPLVHVEGDVGLVHAGLWRGWTLADAGMEAAAVEEPLRSDPAEFLQQLFAKKPRAFEPSMTGGRRLRAVVAVCTRMRICDRSGRPDYEFGGLPDQQVARDRMPWFRVPGRRSADQRVFFGHWSSLGLHRGDGVVGVDTGCVWGNELTAFRLDDERVFQVPCVERPPG